MKTCKRCQQSLPLTGFYSHPRMADGHLNICKVCVRNRVTTHRQENIDEVRAYDRVRGRSTERREETARRSRKYRKQGKPYWKNWDTKNANKKSAQTAVNNAVRDGRLQKEPCLICGREKSEGHHPDYSKPLDVVWLCRKHHAELHRKHLGEITVPTLRLLAQKRILS